MLPILATEDQTGISVINHNITFLLCGPAARSWRGLQEQGSESLKGLECDVQESVEDGVEAGSKGTPVGAGRSGDSVFCCNVGSRKCSVMNVMIWPTGLL